MIREILSAFGYEKRSTEPDDVRYHPDVWGRAVTPGGYVTPESVVSNLSVAHRAIELKATLLASVGLHVYHVLSDGGRERALNVPLARVLARPNDYMSAFEFIELISRMLDLRGNFYARVEHASTGEIRALHPIDPMRVQVERTTSGRLRYRVSASPNEPARVLLDGEMLHVKNASPNGLVGVSPIAAARASLGLAVQQQIAATDLAANGLRAPGIILHPGKLSEKAKENIADSVERTPNRAGRPKVFEEGMRWVATNFSSADAELLESRKLSAEDTARIMGVNPQSVGILGTTSYGSQQQAATDLVVATLAPLAARIEAAIERCLLSAETSRTLMVEFQLATLLRADPTERWRTHDIARRTGVMSVNDIRRLERMPPVIGGDDYTPTQGAAASTEPVASVK